MVYPGEEKVNVVLDPGNIACLNGIDNDMSCVMYWLSCYVIMSVASFPVMYHS